jgi:hypothetical protein
MEKEFVPYEQALALKELGFDEPCFVFWTNTPKYKGDNIQLCITDGMHGYSPNSISFKQDFLREGEVLAPLYQQAFRWFREKYKLVNYIEYYAEWNFEIFRIDDKIAEVQDDVNVDYTFKGGTYEEAELACLIKLIKIVK